MLIKEAKWLGEQAVNLPSELLSPCLNLGSQNEDYQKHHAPWINDFFLNPLRSRGVKITNTDLQAAPGVDIVGDLLDPIFMNRLIGMRFGSAICCNLLEHVKDLKQLAAQVSLIPRPGGVLFVSCPRKYPYHPDPLDNGFRPSPSELSALFSGFKTIVSAEVECGTAWQYWSMNRFGPWNKLARLGIPFVRFKGWQDTARRVPWISKSYTASCCLLQKVAG